MYTIKHISDSFNISVRTIQYYHNIGLLLPTEINSKKYRFYDDFAIDKLRKILVFKEIGLSLNEIKNIFEKKNVDINSLIKIATDALIIKKEKVDNCILLLNKIMEGENVDINNICNDFDIKIKTIKDSILENI